MPTVLQPVSKTADYRRDGQAWLDAADETGLDEQTFPPEAPFTLEQTLDRTYLPD